MLPSPASFCPPLTPNIGPFHHRCKRHAAIVSTVHSGSLNSPLRRNKKGILALEGSLILLPSSHLSPEPGCCQERPLSPHPISVWAPKSPTLPVMGRTLHPPRSRRDRRFSPRLKSYQNVYPTCQFSSWRNVYSWLLFLSCFCGEGVTPCSLLTVFSRSVIGPPGCSRFLPGPSHHPDSP